MMLRKSVTTEMIEEAGVDIPMEKLKQARQRPYVPYYMRPNQSSDN